MRVFINKLTFDTGGKPVVPYLPEALAVAIRDTGLQRRSDFTRYNRLVFNDWTKYGIGWSRMRRDRDSGTHGMRDASALTIHPEQITLGILHEAQTHAAPADHLKRYVAFKGDLWGLFEEDYANTLLRQVSRKYGATSDDWTGGGTIHTSGQNAYPARVWDAVVHKGLLFVLCHSHLTGTTQGVYKVYSSADGITWADASGTGWPDAATDEFLQIAIGGRNDIGDDAGRLLSYADGETLLAAIWETEASADGTIDQVRVYKSTDSGANWSSVVNISSADGPKALVSWFNRSGAVAPVLVTADGVWAIDLTNSKAARIFELDGDANNGRWATVGLDGGLYIGLGGGGLLVLYMDANGNLEVRTSNRGTFPTARQGHINHILAPGLPWLLVAYGGHAASKQASTFAVDYAWQTDPATGRMFQPWHSMYLEGDANVDLSMLGYSTEDDATSRLHFALEGAAASENNHLEEPFTNPASGVTQKFQASSYIDIAEDDLGDPHANGAVYESLVEADDLSATATTSDEYITHKYGADGAAWDAATLGNYLSGTKAQKWGTDSLGLAAKTIRHRLELYRNTAGTPTTTKTPKLKEFEFRAYKNLAAGLLGWIVPIDLEATARTYGRDTEQVITDIESIIGSNILILFEFGKSGTKRVKPVPGRLGEQSAEGERLREEARRTGVAVIQLEQVN